MLMLTIKHLNFKNAFYNKQVKKFAQILQFSLVWALIEACQGRDWDSNPGSLL